jgi:hypothetical protein
MLKMSDFRDALTLTEEDRKLVDDIIYLRGRIITSYSQVEFLLADIAIKLELKFPYPIAARLKAAKRIAERDGYEAYKEELNEICDGLEKYDDIRNFAAHGWADLSIDKQGNHVFDLIMYRREGDGQFNLFRARTSRERLHAAADDINDFTGRVMRLFRRIYMEKRLEE